MTTSLKLISSANWNRNLAFFVFCAMVLALLMSPSPAQLARAQPALLALTATQPEATVGVIVQKTVKDNRVEDLVTRLGGTIRADLHIINAFAAQVKARDAAHLANADGVRWVSLDAAVNSTSTCEHTATRNAIADTELDEAEPDVSDGDTELDEEEPDGSNGVASTIGTVPSPTGKRTFGAVLFDLSSIPTDSIIQSATLGVYVKTARSSAHSDPVHIMTTNWTEAATWNKRDGTNPWANGAFGSNDYSATAIGTIIPSTIGFKALDVTGAVTSWVNGSTANHGFLIRSTGTDTGKVMYVARESATNRPSLTVTYTRPCIPPSTGFVSWASALSSHVSNSFTNAANVFDSALGPNGTFGYGSNKKIALTGIASQATPGEAIGRVEAVLHGYVPVKLGNGDDPKITVWVGGTSSASVTLDHHAFDTFVGAANAGMVYLDITSSRAWKWADFDNNLEIVIDQSANGTGDYIYYDAVGLRVTGVPGTDGTGDTGGDTSALATIDTSKQANVYNQVIRASNLWNTASKLQGKGVTVAIVDSGVFKTKDLDKRVRTNANFNDNYHDSSDRYGHGTFVAGIVAGSGSQSGKKYIGVAPRADLINVRVSDDTGMSTEADVVNALQWALDNKARYNIRVVNLSLNASVPQSYHTSPLAAACEILWFNGIVVVVSAGNNGTATLYPPANDPFVITVGATDDRGTLSTTDDVVASFSAYGTTENGLAKPDLVAPGRNIISLLPENDRLNISTDHSANRIDKTYFRMSGTSMSAPIVSGVVALLLQDEPNLTPDQVKYRLTATANKSWPGYNATTAGAGYLDAFAAVNGTTTQSANTGLAVSQLLTTGSDPVNNTVNWGSVNWGSVNWGSDHWEP